MYQFVNEIALINCLRITSANTSKFFSQAKIVAIIQRLDGLKACPHTQEHQTQNIQFSNHKYHHLSFLQY